MTSNGLVSTWPAPTKEAQYYQEDDGNVLGHRQVKHHVGYEQGHSHAPEVRAGSILYATDTPSPDVETPPNPAGGSYTATIRPTTYDIEGDSDSESYAQNLERFPADLQYDASEAPIGPMDGAEPPVFAAPSPGHHRAVGLGVPDLSPNLYPSSSSSRHLSPDMAESVYSDARTSREATPRRASPGFGNNRKSLPLDFWMPNQSAQAQTNRLSPSASAVMGGAATSSRMSVFDLATAHAGANSEALMPRLQTIELYRKNAQKSNDPVIQFQLAQYMVQTALIPGAADDEEAKLKQKLLKEALAYLRRLAERGHPDAQYLLGDVYSSGAVGGKPDHRQSFHFFLLGAKHGHAEASYRAALCLEEGWGTSRDAARALKFYKAAAARNQPGALYRLGMVYFYGGLGISDNANNRLAGIKWLTRAVNAANDIYNRAPYDLAKIYEAGYKDIVFKDLPYAVKLYVRSAELGFIPAAFKLGQAYELGLLNCPQDAALSIHYYTIGALGNDPRCQLALCAWYTQGAEPHFPKNEDEAYEWALRAAHNGLPKAQFIVGIMLSKGLGCDRDIYMSTQWLKKSAANGFEPAAKRLKGDSSQEQNKECVIM